MTTLDKSAFEEGDTVILDTPSDFYGTAIWYDESGEQQEKTELELPEDGEYEIVSIDYEGGFIYNLRLDGEIDEFDYIRVFGIGEESISRIR